MASIKITTGTVSALMKSAKPNRTTFYFDDELAGFGLYRTTTGTGTFFAEFRPVAGGSKKRLKLGRVGTLKATEAREAARKAIANAALGKDLAQTRSDERGSLTVKDLVSDYIEESVAVNRKESTAALYRILLRKHVAPRLGTTKAVVLTRVDVQRAHAAMSREGRVTANRVVKLISAAYGWGARHGHVPEGTNPASGIILNKEEGRERFLTADEMLAIGSAMIEAETIGLPVDAGTAKTHLSGSGCDVPLRHRGNPALDADGARGGKYQSTVDGVDLDRASCGCRTTRPERRTSISRPQPSIS